MGEKFSKERLCSGVWDEDIANYPEDRYLFTMYGYRCQLERNSYWVYAGFVLLPFCHPDYNKTYKDLDKDIKIHGGLTYGKDGKFGFDCFHGTDISPLVETLKLENPEIKILTTNDNHYWTFPEAKKELNNLAYQFKNRESPGSPIIFLRMAKHKILEK
jgi:hypothetical protein